MNCPRCLTPLSKVHASGHFDCASCEGCAVGLSEVVAKLSKRDRTAFQGMAFSPSSVPGRTRCPHCMARTNQVRLGAHEGALLVDSCAKCDLVWFDRGEWAQLLLYLGQH